MTAIEMKQESLSRAVNGQSLANYDAIYEGFAAKGIEESEIQPRENVFTYKAWQALGRQVRKGEKGVKVFTWVNAKKEISSRGAKREEAYKFCRSTTVFHVSQTDPINAN